MTPSKAGSAPGLRRVIQVHTSMVVYVPSVLRYGTVLQSGAS